VNSKKRCKYDGKYEDAKSGIQTGKGWFCSHDHAAKWGYENRHKGQAVKDKAFKQKVRNFRLTDLPHQKKLTQQAFNEMIRELDKAEGCISCPKPATWQGQWHASHVRTVASMGSLRYDARNCYKSCSICNAIFSGNLAPFREALRTRYGQKLLDWIDGPHEVVKWTGEALTKLRAGFKAETRRLKQGLGPSRDWRKLEEA